MSNWKLGLLAGIGLAFLLGGCEKSSTRELSFPAIDARAAFPELGSTSDKKKSDKASKSAFERSISQALEGDNPAEQPDTVMFQAISLGAGLVGDIPVDFDEWRWASEGKTTLVTHGVVGQAPDVLIYIEPFSDVIALSPSKEMRRFQTDVGFGGTLGRAMALMDGANSATMGQGIGFQPAAGSFSGWRWVGKNDGHITLRLGRSGGVWGPQPPVPPELVGLLEQFAGASPEVAKLQAYMVDVQEKAANQRGVNRGGHRTAAMVLGSASTASTAGVHLAIVCQGSACSQAKELAHFLDSIRVAGRDSGFDAAEISPPTDSLADLSVAAGIAIVPEELRISADRFGDIIRAGQGGGAKDGSNGAGIPEIPGLDLSY